MAIPRKVEHFKDIPFFTDKVVQPDKETTTRVYSHILGANIERGGVRSKLDLHWSANLRVGIGIDRTISAAAITRDGLRIGKLSDFMEEGYHFVEETIVRNGIEYIPGTRILVGIGIPGWGASFYFVSQVDIEEPSVIRTWKRGNERDRDLWYLTVEPYSDLLTSLRGHLRISRPRNP